MIEVSFRKTVAYRSGMMVSGHLQAIFQMVH